MLPGQVKSSPVESQPDEKMEVLVEGKRLSRIKHVDLDGKVTYLTPEELEKKFSFSYTECILGNRQKLASYFKDKALLTELNSAADLPKPEAIRQRLASPFEGFELRDMGGELGHGLFAAEDIPHRTIFFLFAGSVKPEAQKNRDYAHIWGAPGGRKVKHIIEPEGMARFLQHLPQSVEVDKATHKKSLLKNKDFLDWQKRNHVDIDEHLNDLFAEDIGKDAEYLAIQFKNPELKSKMATRNVQVAQAALGNIPVVVCWSHGEIKEGEPLGFLYSGTYWPARKKNPRYLYKNGSVIPLNEYRIINPCERDSVSIKALTTRTENPFLLYQEGIKLFKKGAQENNRQDIDNGKVRIEKALAIFKATKGDDSVECANCYSALSSCYRELQDILKAIEYCQKALEIREKSTPRNPELIEQTQSKLDKLKGITVAEKSVLSFR